VGTRTNRPVCDGRARGRRRSVLVGPDTVLGKAQEKCYDATSNPSIGSEVQEGSTNGAREAKASEDNLTGMGGRRDVLGDGGRCVGGRCADREYAVAWRRTASRHYPRRGGNLRRQPVDVLCVRQGNQRNAPGRPAICPARLQVRRRLQGRRLQVRRPRVRLPMRRRLRLLLWRLRRVRLHVLLVVGRLPALLGLRLG
jgi:hypothetical protein